MDPGNIIFLNGTSSAGKSAIAKSLQKIMDGYYIHTGLDHYLERVPEKIHTVSDGKKLLSGEGFLWVFPDDDKRVSEIRLGPAALKLITGMYHAVIALAKAGNDIIIDDVVFDSKLLQEAANTFHAFNVLFVGVRCPFEVAEERERERGDRTPGLVKLQYDLVHAHCIYDLEVDTSILTSMECASQIKDRLLNGPAPDAFHRLWDAFGRSS